ncbi:MAG: hypothetical protein ACYC1U_09490 [Candidatus Aquicultorales bacterium]
MLIGKANEWYNSRMTVCIAAKADNGKSLVLAADRQSTSLITADTARKILPISETAYLLTAGLDISSTETYKEITTNSGGITTVESAFPVVKEAYTKVMLAAAEKKVLTPRGLTFLEFKATQRILGDNIVSTVDRELMSHVQQYSSILLLAGIDTRGQARIYEFGPSFDGEHAQDFAVIGSGQFYSSISLLIKKYSSRLPNNEAAYRVFEAKKQGELSPDIGDTTDMCLIVSGTSPHIYSNGELTNFNAIYQELLEEEAALIKRKLTKNKESTTPLTTSN